MNMKKTIAGLVASVVAISAMATTMVSAKEEPYSLKSEVWAANWAGDFEVNTLTALTTLVGDVDATAGVSVANITDGVAAQAAGTIDLAFDQPIAELKGKITYAEHVVGGTANAEVKTTKEIVFVDTDDDDKATWAITVKTDSQAVSAGEVYIPSHAVVRNIQFTAKTGEITSTGAKPTAGTIHIKSVSALAGSDLRTALNSLTNEITVGGADADIVQLKGEVVKKDVYEYDIKGATKVTDLEKDYAPIGVGAPAGTPDIKLPVNFRKNANLFFSDAVNGVLTFEFELVPVDAADDKLTGPQTPGDWDIPLLSQTVTTKDIGLALNWNVTSNLVEAKDIVDNKVSFSWDELSKYIAGDGNGTVTDWAIKISSAFDGKYKNIYIKSITFTKDDASAVTDPTAPSTPDASTPGTGTEGNPVTGNAPIALAIIPVALAAAAVVASKKRA